jgi:hypothetical protein
MTYLTSEIIYIDAVRSNIIWRAIINSLCLHVAPVIIARCAFRKYREEEIDKSELCVKLWTAFPLIDETEFLIRSRGVHSIVQSKHFSLYTNHVTIILKPFLKLISVLAYTTASKFSIFSLIKHTNINRNDSTKNSGCPRCYYVQQVIFNVLRHCGGT